jgi:hypothetical protein
MNYNILPCIILTLSWWHTIYAMNQMPEPYGNDIIARLKYSIINHCAQGKNVIGDLIVLELALGYFPILKLRKNGNTLLHFAAQNGDSDLITYLLSKNIDPDIVNNHNETPRDFAYENFQECPNASLEKEAFDRCLDLLNHATKLHQQ